MNHHGSGSYDHDYHSSYIPLENEVYKTDFTKEHSEFGKFPNFHQMVYGEPSGAGAAPSGPTEPSVRPPRKVELFAPSTTPDPFNLDKVCIVVSMKDHSSTSSNTLMVFMKRFDTK